MTARVILPALASLALGACASAPLVTPPQIVTVTKVQYRPLPAADLLPCAYPTAQIVTNGDLLIAEQTAVRSLQVCNAQLDDLRALDQISPAKHDR